ncbi:recombinase family protein [Micavibrio aeruginosavorus]|uniref:Resolvase n=1 Tax=Micavibrio aeruginosavorus EPB TaxID=349215 RepID=M4VE90_9BACT|nr:recombinase family protein [Micavibrio aeruginosavorus]AGH97692.1 resolvase [Micavibrio aeruginosavorus EPB]
MHMDARNCAIYTRKSSEEGLDMDFNSLDAQYEACLSYIASQKSNGWSATKEHYSDGGFSGGNMDRPGLQKLISDIESGKINIVVVYKIDRLTRSLMDFSRLVEAFDRYGVTFVSVTQSFNTTTSMGRLTLNVLLSFAQFEREVTGERIRDKIAASKRKGMWMGGVSPVGYLADGRSLVPDPAYVDTVQFIFDRYLYWGCVSKLKSELDRTGVRTREWVSQKGHKHGAVSFSRGMLYKILRNPVYVGKISHKADVYDGQHAAIIDKDTWHNVQKCLANNSAQQRGERKVYERDLLKGILFDIDGNVYSPTYALKKGRRYRYYVNQAILQYKNHPKGVMARLPAHELETLIFDRLRCVLKPKILADIFCLDEHDDSTIHYIAKGHELKNEQLFHSVVSRVDISSGYLTIRISATKLRSWIIEQFSVILPDVVTQEYSLKTEFFTQKSKTGSLILLPEKKGKNKSDPFGRPEAEVRSWIQGVVWRDEHFNGMPIQRIAEREGVSATHIVKYINQTFSVI